MTEDERERLSFSTCWQESHTERTGRRSRKCDRAFRSRQNGRSGSSLQISSLVFVQFHELFRTALNGWETSRVGSVLDLPKSPVFVLSSPMFSLTVSFRLVFSLVVPRYPKSSLVVSSLGGFQSSLVVPSRSQFPLVLPTLLQSFLGVPSGLESRTPFCGPSAVCWVSINLVSCLQHRGFDGVF